MKLPAKDRVPSLRELLADLPKRERVANAHPVTLRCRREPCQKPTADLIKCWECSRKTCTHFDKVGVCAPCAIRLEIGAS